MSTRLEDDRNKDTGICPKCGKSGRLRTITANNVDRFLCEKCIQILQRKWTDWYSK